MIRLRDVWENLAKLPISHKWEALERNACKGKVPLCGAAQEDMARDARAEDNLQAVITGKSCANSKISEWALMFVELHNCSVM